MDNKHYEWESIDDDLFAESGEKLVEVSDDVDYAVKMGLQNGRVLKFLQEKYPERTFRISAWHPHDFGPYQEIEEKIAYEDDSNEE